MQSSSVATVLSPFIYCCLEPRIEKNAPFVSAITQQSRVTQTKDGNLNTILLPLLFVLKSNLMVLNASETREFVGVGKNSVSKETPCMELSVPGLVSLSMVSPYQ